MISNLKEKYKVHKSYMQQTYEYQLALKHNEEYEKRVDRTFLEIAKLLIEFHPNIKMEAPREREKTPRSIRGKIKKLEIERLCKLYAIDGLNEEEKTRLYTLLIERLESEIDIKKDSAEKIVNQIFYGVIENLDIINKLMEEDKISDNTKTALLRITKIRIECENIQNEKILNEEIEQKYGQTASKTSNIPEKNLLHWECIEETKQDEEKLEKLRNPLEYLKAKDLRGFKFIISDVPKNVQTNSEELRQLLEKRENASIEEVHYYNDLCCIALSEEFVNDLISNEDVLEKLNIEVITDGYKHKEKLNGYIAEHVKFCYKDRPEYIFEMQFRSAYREELSRANGPAAHDKRVGKKRVFPSVENKNIFMRQVEDIVPKYKIITRNGNKLLLRKCCTLENMLQYYLGYVDLDSEEYIKAMEYLEEENENIK